MCRVRVCVMILAGVLLAGCRPLPEQPTVMPTDVRSTVESSLSSPIAVPTAAAAPSLPVQESAETGGRFEIDRPVKALDTVVRGSGPSGSSIVLFDVTQMGIELGSTTIGDDGRFMISVQPLTGNVRIGIQLAEQNDAIWADKTLLGPEALVLPFVGMFVDTAFVAP